MMETFLLPDFWAKLMRIVFLDLALAGDNAVVIALAVRGLPARDQFLGRGLWNRWGDRSSAVFCRDGYPSS